MSLVRFVWRVGAALALLASAAFAQAPAPRTYQTVAPMGETVDGRIRPQIEALFERLFRDGRNLELGGVRVFDAGDRFLPGKLALAFAELMIRQSPARHQIDAARFRELADMTLTDPNESWGVYYYALALYELDRAGLLAQSVRPETLQALRAKLDWRTFVDPETFELTGGPANYYGVAFAIARLRHRLGWEDASASEALFARIALHYRNSGESGLQDETGEGRFDRYSMLMSAEVAQHFIETGESPPEDVRVWLRRAADVALPRMNLRGEGFEYGRSIGAYGDTALVEVLTVAARAGVLSREEMDLAYGFASRAAARYADFWLDAATGSVNLWSLGRRTDGYRGARRMLGENLSLAHQYFYTSEHWRDLGYAAPSPSYAATLARLPRRTVTWFARGADDRLLVTLRDRERIFGLPFINGGRAQHANTPYIPSRTARTSSRARRTRRFPNSRPGSRSPTAPGWRRSCTSTTPLFRGRPSGRRSSWLKPASTASAIVRRPAISACPSQRPTLFPKGASAARMSSRRQRRSISRGSNCASHPSPQSLASAASLPATVTALRAASPWKVSSAAAFGPCRPMKRICTRPLGRSAAS